MALAALGLPPGQAAAAATERDAGGVLYRCHVAGAPPSWQDVPCDGAARQRELQYTPEPDAEPVPVTMAEAQRLRTPRPARANGRPAAGPTRPVPACERAMALAAARRGDDGRRLPVHEIRAREREAARACGD